MNTIMYTLIEYTLRTVYFFAAVFGVVFLLDLFVFGITGMSGSFTLSSIEMIIDIYGGVK